ncbi:hypothetical protein STAS_32411 [Striga asiatica]|uniref:Uncharacterized protein n=1 Tax=Striga asiatica TaxID=4170 RepID=A0A5A7RAN8_STRAF|nr:hypothetical protein STAS_32411 [Striga asiatica]
MAPSSTPVSLFGPPDIYTLPAAASPSTSKKNPFMDHIQMVANFNNFGPIGLTENHSLTFLSSGETCLDFFFNVVPKTPSESLVHRLGARPVNGVEANLQSPRGRTRSSSPTGQLVFSGDMSSSFLAGQLVFSGDKRSSSPAGQLGRNMCTDAVAGEAGIWSGRIAAGGDVWQSRGGCGAAM